MIPIVYKLRENIRFEDRGDSSLVISEVPLNVVRASQRAVRILQLCDGEKTLRQIADNTEHIEEEQVFRICEYFNRKAVLEVCVAENQGYFPSITIIIPTRDRAASLAECLQSLAVQEYDANLIEIIVVDDNSQDETQKAARGFSCTLLANPQSRGQAYCRNIGAQQAKGEVLAFLDDDCVAGPAWLRDLVPYLQWEEIGAVGGYVDGYKNRSRLDRYEKKFSLLNLGKYILRGATDLSTFYVPTCNMLVRKKAFMETGGIRESLHLGEDVDFCWRMRDDGRHILYVPAGSVKHKHRNTIRTWLRRRADYGTSEALLASLHPRRIKRLQMRPLAAAAFAGACCAVVLLSLFPLLATCACYIAETAAKVLRLRRRHVRISSGNVCFSVLRMYVSYFYRMSYHLVRYYLFLLVLLGIVFPTLWLLGFCFLILTASTDYAAKRPRLGFPVFFFYYIMDQLSYQLGVLAGCLRARSFRSYRLSLFR